MRRWPALVLALACTCACAATRARPSACDQLQQTYKLKTGRSEELVVSVYGRARRVAVYGDGRAAGAAAAGLLRAAAAALGARWPAAGLAPDLCTLALRAQERCENMEFNDSFYDEIILAPSMAWDGGPCLPLLACHRYEGVLLPARLRARPAAAPAALRLHAALPRAARADVRCRPAAAAYWQFYADREALRACRFTRDSGAAGVEPVAVVWYASDSPRWKDVVGKLNASIFAAELQENIRFMPVESDAALRRRISGTLREDDSSILFLDYDLWADEPGVTPVTPPPCAVPACEPELDATRALRAADVDVLSQKAPLLLNLFYRFAPTARHLREILEMAANDPESNVTEAACAWAARNADAFDSWLRERAAGRYWIAVIVCDGDPSKEIYRRTAAAVRNYTAVARGADVRIRLVSVDCSGGCGLNDKFVELTSGLEWPSMVGAVVVGAAPADAAAAAHSAAAEETALAVAGPAPSTVSGPAPAAAFSAGGDLYNLARATAFFISGCDWRRVAIISEPTRFAEDFVSALRRDGRLTLRNVELADGSTEFSEDVLLPLRDANARVYYLNVNSSASAALLCAARDLGMTSAAFVWMLREWPPESYGCAVPAGTNLFTISYRWRGETLADETQRAAADENLTSLRSTLFDLWRGAWPAAAVPMADALLTLIRCFKTFEDKYGERLYDLHGAGNTRLLLENLEEPNQGVLQLLNYTGGALATHYVFLHKWDGLKCESIAQWRITNGDVTVVHQQRSIRDHERPGDGSATCYTHSYGDDFDPNCQDVVWLSTACCTLLVLVLLYTSQRMRLKRLARLEDILKAQLLAQNPAHTNHSIKFFEESALSLDHKLGSGVYGFVRYGVLRAPGTAAVPVAAKELDVGASIDSELIREAVMLASLDHENIVRLIGVCRYNGPLLILMEYAFFGDLRNYLCERRHLVACPGGNPDDTDERVHVSAEALTRLGAQAAAALEYLEERGVVHRDVRAANCLVDGRRALKLGDFGLARRTAAAGAASEYASRRRGLFPVLWMAPESLERGVFSAAADAWALGVLLLELATLGGRPYGEWPPPRVLRHVRAGGRPPLPPDLCRPARQLLSRCWALQPAERARAGSVRRALGGPGAVLRPALRPPAGCCRAPPAYDAAADAEDREGFTYYFS